MWADSLCIVQGDDTGARADWISESANMANVYGNAYLTIAASWGSSMHPGLFATRKPDTSADITLGLRSLDDPRLRGVVEFVRDHTVRLDSGDEPLFRRGWALQERVLSPRVLICNRDQLA
jgi:hypothetical protein